MFGLWRRKDSLVHKAWIAVVDDFSIPTEQFYNAIEQDLTSSAVPDLALSREIFAEGGILSAKRMYLRMRRERLVFDVCSAPFGKRWFFSCRFTEFLPVVYVWQLLLVLAVMAAAFYAYFSILGQAWGIAMFLLNVMALTVFLRNAVALELRRLDDFLLRLPVFGVIYEVFFRTQTYHREDSRALYIHVVEEIVKGQMHAFTGEKGINFVDVTDPVPVDASRLAAALRTLAK